MSFRYLQQYNDMKILMISFGDKVIAYIHKKRNTKIQVQISENKDIIFFSNKIHELY